MTNEEALTRIKSTDYCFVVWSTAVNEVVAVKPLRAWNEARGARSEFAVETVRETDLVGYGDGPTLGRFFTSTTVTMSTLRDQQTAIARTAERVRLLHTLPEWDTEELILPLETGVFPANFSARNDGELLIRELYYARFNQLSSQQLDRLEAVAAEASSSEVGSSTPHSLECALAVIRADRSRLERLWERARAGKEGARALSLNFVIAVGDLALDRGDIITRLVRTVETGWPFHVRFLSMLALGKIGAPAGERAAESIATHIYDSSDKVSTVRDLVLSRIRTPRSAWKPCGVCVRGMVRREGYWRFTACSQCLGMGHVLVTDVSD